MSDLAKFEESWCGNRYQLKIDGEVVAEGDWPGPEGGPFVQMGIPPGLLHGNDLAGYTLEQIREMVKGG